MKILALAAFSIIPATALSQSTQVFDPPRTRVFAVGILEWSNTDAEGKPLAQKNEKNETIPYVPFASFDKAGRRDAELVNQFRIRGVPESQIDFVRDKDAKVEATRTRLISLLKKSASGETLFLYFTAHGVVDEKSGATSIAMYNARPTIDGWRNVWGAKEIVDLVETQFLGDRVIIAGDFCYSGGFVTAVATLGTRAKKSYAVFSSSQSNVPSTGNFTFTTTLMKAIRGFPTLDRDGDGLVSLNEMADSVEAEMAFSEYQLPASLLTGWFAVGKKTIATVSAALPFPEFGAHRLVENSGRPVRARLVGESDGTKYRVQYIDRALYAKDSSENPIEFEVVPNGRVRRFEPVEKKQADPLKTDLYKVTIDKEKPLERRLGWIVDSKLGVYRIRFKDYRNKPDRDEWIGSYKITDGWHK